MDDQLSAIDLEYLEMVRRVMQEVYQALSLRPAGSGFSGSVKILQRYRFSTSILGVGSGDVDLNEYSILEEMPPD